MSESKDKIKLLEEKQIRHEWDEENEKYWLSVVDVCAALTDSDYQTARKYWKVLKGRKGETIDPEQSIERAIRNCRRLGYSEIVYNFSFADYAVEYLETRDTALLQEMCKLDATEHLFNHASRYNPDMPGSKEELVTLLLSELEAGRLPEFKRVISFARKIIAKTNLLEIVSQFLPRDIEFSNSVFFTLGYDIGGAYGSNCSINLAHPHFLGDMNEIKYYFIHELHHACFIQLKGSMPSLEITTRKEMAEIIEYFTHLEGMGTYAPLEIREADNTMCADKDYIVLQDSKLMAKFEKEYLEIYSYFKINPNSLVVGEDWHKIDVLSDGKRLWYTVGAHMARTIDRKAGRDKLTSLISEPSENFISAYLSLK